MFLFHFEDLSLKYSVKMFLFLFRIDYIIFCRCASFTIKLPLYTYQYIHIRTVGVAIRRFWTTITPLGIILQLNSKLSPLNTACKINDLYVLTASADVLQFWKYFQLHRCDKKRPRGRRAYKASETAVQSKIQSRFQRFSDTKLFKVMNHSVKHRKATDEWL